MRLAPVNNVLQTSMDINIYIYIYAELAQFHLLTI